MTRLSEEPGRGSAGLEDRAEAETAEGLGTPTNMGERGGRSGWRLLAIAAIVALAAVVLSRLGGEAAAVVTVFAAWVQGLGWWGPAALIAGYIVGTVAMVPGSLISLAAGAIFGAALGGLYVFAGATLGASASFLIARYLARSAVQRRFGTDRRFAALDRVVAEDGRRIVFLLRLSPLVPFNLLNYLLGLTRIRFVDFVVASLGMIPGVALYVYAGHLAGDLARVASGVDVARGTSYYLLLAIGLAATAAVTLLVARKARAALAEESA